MSLRSTFLRARWLLLLLPLFALASTMQVGCNGAIDPQSRVDDFAHEDPKAGAPSSTNGKDRNHVGGYVYDDDGYYPYDDGEGTYGYE